MILSEKIEIILFDADDTLWANNIYYLKAIDEFINLITAAGFQRDMVENTFDELEIKVVKERGYGSQNFVFILESLFAEFSGKSKKLIDRANLEKIITQFNLHPIQPPVLFAGVIETLEYLSKKYRLYLLTKGDYTEQQGKIQRAGVLPYFTDYFIPDEKDDTTYKNLLKEMKWKAESTCMVGNSPKSDINPALRNGMYAVFIPYKETWKLDKEPVQSIDGRLVILENFSDLKKIF
ncbi:MAG: HAD family hydrolase [Calditrichaceae bacterium]|nr:HAD family hydrolase [Calditrichaceae bacterium]MBN2710113.1 HAD family hydrolase [Calditrichaceae bacterium]